MASASPPDRDSREAGNAGQEERSLIEETLALWQPYSARRLTPEDARQIIANVVGFFDLLNAWDTAERRKEADLPQAGVDKE